MASPYSTHKIAWHPEKLEDLRKGRPTGPIFVQFFPTNVCNQACDFCSYGHWDPSSGNPDPSKWKNHKLFDEKTVMPEAKMLETLADLASMGCKAVELSGGGEPTAYLFFDKMARTVRGYGMDLALVTNGVLLNDKRTDMLRDIGFTWVRVSIDAGSNEEYMQLRHVPPTHWAKAWSAVERLAKIRTEEEQRVGVGYVIDRNNWKSIYDFCRMAKEHGADNVRIAMSFTPEGTSRWEEAAKHMGDQIDRAIEDFEDLSFQINDLSRERLNNVVVGKQTYPFCFFKEISCIIGGDSNIYSCCSLAYNPLGLMGTIRDKSFKEAWFGEITKWREEHDPRKDCPVWCLYQRRNLSAIQLMGDPEMAERIVEDDYAPPHVNFV